MEVFIYLYNKERESQKWTRFLFWCLLLVTTKKQGIRPRWFFVYECVCLCVCARVWVTCSHYTKRTFLMAVLSLTFSQTSCRYMSSSRWLQDNLARFLVIILPAEGDMRSVAAEVEGTARTFLPKRAIHGTTKEAHLNSVRGFLCVGIACRRILHREWNVKIWSVQIFLNLIRYGQASVWVQMFVL